MVYYFFRFFFYVLLFPFTKVLGQCDQLKKDWLNKGNEMNMVQESSILVQKWSDFWPFVNIHAMHSGGISRERVRSCGCWH